MNNIAIFASGSGTNAENLINYFSNDKSGCVTLVLSNNPDAKVLKRAERLGVTSYIFDRNDFYNSKRVLELLEKSSVDFIVLAGFLWLVPSSIIKAFDGRIVNIHPALLPKYGGKGMYGDRVHQAVIENRETESGITIHFVNEIYDDGAIIFQARCKVLDGDTTDSLAKRIHELEYRHFPEIVRKVIEERVEK